MKLYIEINQISTPKLKLCLIINKQKKYICIYFDKTLSEKNVYPYIINLLFRVK